MGRHFCCCFPLRLGVFIISLVQVIIYGLSATGAWIEISGHWPSDVGKKFKQVAFAFAVYWTMMTLLSLAGFIGSIRRSISSLRLYARGLGFALIVSLAIDALYIWAAFTTSHADFVQRCINGSTDQKTIDACNSKDAGTIVKVLVVVVAVITLGVQIWATVITSQYGDKLLEEQAWRANIVGGPRDVPVPMTGSGGKYASAPLDEARAPLTGATYAYPYTDSSNSHGQAYDPPQHGV